VGCLRISPRSREAKCSQISAQSGFAPKLVPFVADRKFIKQLEAYFTRTGTGRYRTQWIVPTPFFVASDMIYLVQVADLCIYCVNWGFRLPSQGMDGQARQEIVDELGPWMHQLQFHGAGYRDGRVFESFGICYVPNPYGPGRA
jgi:hypothetical protein